MRAPALGLLLLGAVAAVLLLGGSDASRVADPERPAPAREAAVSGIAPRAPVLRCRDRITDMDPLFVYSEDLVVGPVAFAGTGTYAAEWDSIVAEDQWLKLFAFVQAGARVTFAVPPGQRRWMRLEWAGWGPQPNHHAITLAACRQRESVFVGGFTIDYARAPKQGRCADLIVWTGRSRPVLVRPFEAACRAA
jgi:hypothetical protein